MKKAECSKNHNGCGWVGVFKSMYDNNQKPHKCPKCNGELIFDFSNKKVLTQYFI